MLLVCVSWSNWTCLSHKRGMKRGIFFRQFDNRSVENVSKNRWNIPQADRQSIRNSEGRGVLGTEPVATNRCHVQLPSFHSGSYKMLHCQQYKSPNFQLPAIATVSKRTNIQHFDIPTLSHWSIVGPPVSPFFTHTSSHDWSIMECFQPQVKVRILHTVKNTDGTGSITSVVDPWRASWQTDFASFNRDISSLLLCGCGCWHVDSAARQDFEDIQKRQKMEEKQVESKKQMTNSQVHFRTNTNTAVCAEVTMRQQEHQEERAP